MTGIAVTLPAEDWNKVLAILAQAPWNVANPLIMQMGEQLRLANMPPIATPRQGNNVDHDPLEKPQ